MAISIEITFLMFAFGICSDLLHEVRTYKDSAIMYLSLLFAFYRCQVDRRALRITLVNCPWLLRLLCSLFTGMMFTISLQAQGASIPHHGPAGLIWEVPLETEGSYTEEVSALINAYEAETGARLVPGLRGKVGIKVNSRSGRGLSTPLGLLRSVIEAFEKRGFQRQAIFIVDHSMYELQEAGVLSPLSKSALNFEGCPVYALDRELYYDKDWFYDSPLPPSRDQNIRPADETSVEPALLSEGATDRKSFLPMPLLFDVDFWVNLAVGVDNPALGIDGALANATLWNVSNSQRFLRSEATASVAVAEIAAIPELNERMLLHFVSLERYQYIGGPKFNSLYTHSEPILWMSSDPVAIDRLLFERINGLRRNNGFPEIDSIPRQLIFAARLGLGVFEETRIQVKSIPTSHGLQGKEKY